MRRAVGARLAALRLAALAGGTALLALPVAPAAASTQAASTQAASPKPAVAIAITSVTPGIAKPNGTVTVSGYMTNTTAQTMAGLSVQLWSSNSRLANRDDMASYLSTSGSTGVDRPVTGAETSQLIALAPHASRQWSIQFRTSQVGMSAFGVYPLAAQVNQSGLQIDAARTFLVYWPGKSERSVLRPVSLAWVWPLIAAPQRAACPALLSDALAASVSGTGRLQQLLAAGSSLAGRRADLTWAIDPALLSELSSMTRPYRVGGSDSCTGGSARQASPAAAGWLSRLAATTSHQSFFVTPYADVDVAALAHRGLDGELANAFSDGRAEARAILHTDQRPGGTAGPVGTAAAGAAAADGGSIPDRPGANQAAGIAWPADGRADYGVLGSLAVNGVGTVLLDQSMMQPTVPLSYTPTAVTSTPDGVGTQLNVLLTDDGLSQILDSAPTMKHPAGQLPAGPESAAAAAAAFGTRQEFLAETAMIAAEAPSTPRAVVVAPPRRWDPATGLASALLAETTSAPWLRPASLAGLASQRPATKQVPRRPPPQTSVSPSELKPWLLHQVRRLTTEAQLQGRILSPPQPGYLSTAIAAAESSAWRGPGAGHRAAQALLHRISAYLTAQQRAVRIIDPSRVTLGGKSGSVPVSVSNHLGHDIRVQLNVRAQSSGRIQIGSYTRIVTVAAGTQKPTKIPVRAAAAGSTTLIITLSAPGGPPLPGQSATLTVAATHFGTLALVIIGIALGVFLLTSVGRAVRRGGGRAGGAAGEPAGDPDDDPETVSFPAESATAVGAADSVGAEPPDDQELKEPDEHASAPGRADRR